MSKFYKASRAAQARNRRKRKSKHLKFLQQQSRAPGATSSLKREYDEALKRHTKWLKTNRELGGKNWPVMLRRNCLARFVKLNGSRKLKKLLI